MHPLIEQLKRHEGFRGRPYQDTTGHITIGYGRNLDDRPLTEGEATALLLSDISAIGLELERAFPVVTALNPARQAALMNMAFNLGIGGLKNFKRMWAAVMSRDWMTVEAEALDSKWARQVGNRATEIARMLRSGDFPPEDLR